ncbi:MAG: T9SS type A sorting domain-containing protein [Salinivirgaceae bacterium]|nr:T9SS type A sorting domain-containing protein [Salinivirgaceae bacterium]
MPDRWESAKMSIYDIKGELLYNSDMTRKPIHEVRLDVYTGYYFVKLNINGIIFAKKVLIVPK